MKKYLLLILIFFLLPSISQATFGDTITYAGKLKYGDGKSRLNAYFDFPEDITENNGIYISLILLIMSLEKYLAMAVFQLLLVTGVTEI